MTRPWSTDPTNLGNPGSSRSVCLRFTNGAYWIVIRADSYLRDLYRVRSSGHRTLAVGERRGIVTIRCPRVSSCDWLGCRSERPAEVALSTRILWNIEIRGGASKLDADLRRLRLGSFSLEGGASSLEVVLPAPSGTVAVVILGGASNVAIRRPERVAARLRVEGGATNLKFDERHIAAAGGELDLRSTNYDDAAGRSDITITGGANNLSVSKQRGANAHNAMCKGLPHERRAEMDDRSRQLEEFVQKWATAEQREDVAFLEEALTDDFVGVGPLGFMLNKEQWLGRYARGLSYESFGLDEIETRFYGEAAVATCRQKQAGEFQGNDVGGEFRATLIFAEREGRWLLAGLHLSPIAGAPSFLNR